MAQGNFEGTLSSIFKPVLETIADSLSTALNRKVSISLGEIRPVDIDEISSDFPEELVVGQSTFSEGFHDELDMVLNTQLTAILADLMLMGEGDQEFNPAEHIDGITELFNQIGGVLSTYLSSMGGPSIKVGQLSSNITTVAEHSERWSSFFRIDFNLSVQGFEEGSLIFMLAPQTVSDLQELKSEAEAPMEDRPPPAVLDDDEEAFIGSFDESGMPTEVRSASFEEFGASGGVAGDPQNIEAIMDIDLPVVIELGRTTMFIRDILELSPGSIVELNKLSGEPVDLYINDKRFARGEVVVIDENFGIRVTDLIKVEDRIKTLR